MRPFRAFRAAAALALLAAGACTDRANPLDPEPGGAKPPPDGPGAPPVTRAALDCTASRERLTVIDQPDARLRAVEGTP